MDFQLTHGLHRALQQQPTAIATVFHKRRQSWQHLAERCARLARVLQDQGMTTGSRVGILALNSDRYLEGMLGTWWGGGALNPVNIRWSVAEIAYSLDDCDTQILLVDDQFAGCVDELRARSKSLRVVIHIGDGKPPPGLPGCDALLAEAAPIQDLRSGGEDLAGVFYTGGTTGFPKGVMLSHNALAFNAIAGLLDLNYAPDDIILAVPPLFHQAGMCIVVRAVVRGCRTVFVEGFEPTRVLDAIVAERPTFTLLVPTMLQRLLDHPGFDSYDLGSMKRILYGASPIGEGLLRRALSAMPGIRLFQGYGMTETGGPYTVLSSDYHTLQGGVYDRRLHSAGRPIWGMELRVLDAAGRDAPRGAVGEIVARGPGLMQGYWGRASETAACMRDGWMHSGDAGYLDDEGFVYIVDRVKDMIVTGGENVYSAEVESALSRHPAVASCAVIGIPSERWGEAVHAVVVLRDGAGLTFEQARAHCKELIAAYKCPQSLELRDSLPVSGVGKLQKHLLREPHWHGHQRRVG